MAKQDRLTAYLNHGRWIIQCPRCNTALPAREDGVVCPHCWPAMLAKAFQPLPNGLLRPVADMELIGHARDQAKKKGEVYMPVFPEDKAEIEQILRMRPKMQHVNWKPGETVDMLRAQNIERGDPVPPEKE